MSIEDIARIQTSQNTELRHKINELEQQNAELVAHNQLLLSYIVRLSNTYNINPSLHFELQEVAEQTPKQSLANIKADAIDDMMDELSGNINYDSVSDYANQLREQIK